MTAEAKPDALRIERTFEATIDEVWRMWTTREGIEAWWGPDGFSVEVHSIDLRPGGVIEYAQTAVGEQQVAFLQRAGLALTTESRNTFTEVEAPTRLAWVTEVDFVPDHDPYPVATVVELSETAEGVRLVLIFDPMHDEGWTRMAVLGRESELGKLSKVFESRR
jgi:uncharacterized protein YndB with AHSA1/START domain